MALRGPGALLLFSLAACGGSASLRPGPSLRAPDPAAETAARDARPPDPTPAASSIAARARAWVGLPGLPDGADDCAAFVERVYQESGIALRPPDARPGEGAVAAVFRLALRSGALHRGIPRPGDLVFFHDTYDRNRDGRRNDGLTHVGIVESVAPDGTVVFIHRISAGIRRSSLNLRRPAAARGEDGEVWNDVLRRPGKRTRAYLTGELFSGYASASRLWVVLSNGSPPPRHGAAG